jgi:hypothetical protein
VALFVALGAALFVLALVGGKRQRLTGWLAIAVAAYLRIRKDEVGGMLVIKWEDEGATTYEESAKELASYHARNPDKMNLEEYRFGLKRLKIKSNDPFQHCSSLKTLTSEAGYLYRPGLSYNAMADLISQHVGRGEFVGTPVSWPDGHVEIQFHDSHGYYHLGGIVEMRRDASGQWHIGRREIQVIGG